MPNISFTFAAALFALPLAGVPILLHLLFKQKSPVVMFSTLRFVKLSVQRTAARRRVQKWLLLACRALLVLLLIFAVAGPKIIPSSAFGNGIGGERIAAAIVVDTSYSMKLQDGQVELLSKADAMVQDLLRDQLAGARVALFTSKPSADGKAESARDASAILTEWSPLQPQPADKPLVDRVKTAVRYLDRQTNDQKWLVVISDFQTQEFPEQIPELKDGRTVLLDLHVAEPRSAGITKITMEPAQPMPGIPSVANVEITGQPNDSAPVTMKIENVGDISVTEVSTSQAAEARLDSSGHARVQFPVTLPADRWLRLTAAFTRGDSMAWDDSRSILIEVPPKQHVIVLQQGAGSFVDHGLALALDPWEGKVGEWPLAVTRGSAPSAKDDVAVVSLTRWPDARSATDLLNFARSGHTVVLFLAPGMERSWAALSQFEKDALTELLPSSPIQRAGSSLCRAAVADARDPLLSGLIDDKFQLNAIVVRQLVPLAATGNSSTILNAAPADPTPGSRTQGLLYRKPVGRGMCFTCATIPDSQFTNLATHPIFLPLLVRMALKTAEQGTGQNAELGQPLIVDGSLFPGEGALELLQEKKPPYIAKATVGPDGSRQFIFTDTDQPGIYRWRSQNKPAVLAMANVELPHAESALMYRAASEIAAGRNTVIASDLAQLKGKIESMTAPQPKWNGLLATVMFLLCLEALLGSWSKLWKPSMFRAFLPGMKDETPAAA